MSSGLVVALILLWIAYRVRMGMRANAGAIGLERESRDFSLTLPRLRAVLDRELRTLLRSRRAFWTLVVLSLAVSGAFLLLWANALRNSSIATRTEYSRTIFTGLFQLQFFGLGLISAILTSTSVTTERENKTLDLILCSGVTRLELLAAKWLAAILYQVILVIAILPSLTLSLQLGGVGADEYAAAALLIALGIAAYGMTGLAVSALSNRTVVALVGAVLAAIALSAILPIRRVFEWNRYQSRGVESVWDSGTLFGVAFLLATVWLVSTFVAWRGLIRLRTAAPAIAEPLIDDPALLEVRRRTWPYYLIDPQARAQEIDDRKNPVFAKEERTGGLAKLPAVIRLGYLGLASSMVFGVIAIESTGMEGGLEYWRRLVRMQLGFVLLFTPILAATGLSREREEKTLDLLRATTLDPRRIVWAKFAISLRLVIGLCLSVLIVPIVMLMGMDILDSNPPRADPRILSPSMPAVLPFLFVYPIFFAALSLFCSSMCRRNAASIVSSYMAMGFLIALPPLIDLTWDLLDAGSGETGGMRAVGWTRDMLLPLFSPFFYFARAEGGERPHAYESWQSPRQVIAAAGLILVMTRVIYLATVRKVAAAGEGIAWGVGRGEARERKRKLRELEGARVKWIASGIAEDEKERER